MDVEEALLGPGGAGGGGEEPGRWGGPGVERRESGMCVQMHLGGEILDQGVCWKQESVVSGAMRLACKSTGKKVQV